MDDGSDRVITRIPKQETRSSASLWLAVAGVFLVLLGAGCSKSSAPVVSVQDQKVKRIIQDAVNSKDVQSTDGEVMEPEDTKVYVATDYPMSGDCLSSTMLWVVSEGKKIDWTGSTFPEPSQDLKTALNNKRLWQLCFSSKESAYYFSMVAATGTPVLELPSKGAHGQSHVLGFWKGKGFGNQNSKVMVSPAFSAQGGGDESFIENLKLIRTTSGYAITGDTGGGDGPSWWNATVRYDGPSNKLKVVKQCENSGGYQDETGKEIPENQNCKTF